MISRRERTGPPGSGGGAGLERHVTHAGVRYRSDIDGLRAVAVVSVVLYHAGFAAFGGGFVGVDVFFVISGYLIMSVIAADVAQRRFSLAVFYERRTRRIFPALFVVALFCLLVALIIYPPARLVAFGRSLLAMSLFVSNMYFRGIATQHGYFDEASESQLLLHTWSLAVEEQFYILLPPILALLRPLRPVTMRSVLVMLAVASFAWSAYTVAFKPNYAFYVVFPRAWELLAGSLLAIGVAPSAPNSRFLREAAAAAGLSLLLYPVFFFTSRTAFPGPNALWPVAGTLLVVWAGLGGPSLTARMLSWRPVVFVGLISYSVYLWHWPLLVLTRYVVAAPPDTVQVLSALALACAASVASFVFVERPFRRGGALLRRRGVFVGGGVLVACAVLASVAVLATGGLAGRFAPATDEAMALNLRRKTQNATCVESQKDFASVTDIDTCPIDANPDSRVILFWGDSHVAQFRPLIETLSKEGVFGDREIRFATGGGCLPSPTMNRTDGPYRCASFAKLALDMASDARVATVFLGFSAWYERGSTSIVCEAGLVTPCTPTLIDKRHVAERLAAQVRSLGATLRARHVGFVVMLPMPSYNKIIPDLEINRLTIGDVNRTLERIGFLAPLERDDHDPSRRLIADAAHDVGATLFDPRQVLCRGADCMYERDDVSLYTDTSHIASSQIGMFHDVMTAAFREVLTDRHASARPD